MQTNLIHVVGNRPQFIKLAVLYKALSANAALRQMIIHTGQHHTEEMSGIFFQHLDIPTPDVQLSLQHASGNIFKAQATDALVNIFQQQPTNTIVLTYGDTNTTMAGALAAKQAGLRLLHFEGGVRTGHTTMPEEINRIITDRLSDAIYCCTQLNYQNLLDEGYGAVIPAEIFLTGDLMYDAFLRIPPADAKPPATDYVACTIHRAGNITTPWLLKNIVDALNVIHKEIEVVMPVHPHTRKRLREFGISAQFTQVPPLGYAEMKSFLQGSAYVITDSGGASREAYFSKKRSLIIMDSPFWPEIIKAGTAVNTEPDTKKILDGFAALPTLPPNFDTPIFGKGDAAEQIARHIQTFI